MSMAPFSANDDADHCQTVIKKAIMAANTPVPTSRDVEGAIR